MTTTRGVTGRSLPLVRRHLVRRVPSERHYAVSKLPVAGAAMKDPDARRTVLLSVYAETLGAWKTLTDARFKLLALLPPVAAVALVAVVSESGPLAGQGRWVRAAGALFGLLVTLGLWIYDRRNDALYDDLISRGRRVEFELGVETGIFLGRRKAAAVQVGGHTFRPVSHGQALSLVYGTVLTAWLAALVALLVGALPS